MFRGGLQKSRADRKPCTNHVCANGQIAEIYAPDSLTTQVATEGGGMGGNFDFRE